MNSGKIVFGLVRKNQIESNFWPSSNVYTIGIHLQKRAIFPLYSHIGRKRLTTAIIIYSNLTHNIEIEGISLIDMFGFHLCFRSRLRSNLLFGILAVVQSGQWNKINLDLSQLLTNRQVTQHIFQSSSQLCVSLCECIGRLFLTSK